jgi:hypothetical protein
MVDVITLPTTPLYNAASPALISQAADLVSPLGGATQRILRLGSRFSIDVTYPAMKYADGRQFLARMIRAEASPVAVAFPQRGFAVGAPGAPVVDGAGQTGGVLAIRGATAGYVFSEGQFFGFVSGGRRYVHLIVSDQVVAGDGAATLGIAPLMRVSPADGDVLEMTPILEGFIQFVGKKLPWTIEMVRRVGVKFTVVEDR